MSVNNVNINIYIVDDEPEQVEMLIEMLRLSGFNAQGFTLASSFIKQNITKNDIVVLDLNMPMMDGIEVMRTLHDKLCKPDYLLMSGFDERVLHSAKQFAEAKQLSVKEVFTKPLDTMRFLKLIGELYQEKKSALQPLSPSFGESKKNVPKADTSLTLDELRQAIQQQQFVLFYQPKIDLTSGQLLGLEALIRLKHPEKGLITPNRFIPLAEQNILISQLTGEVINNLVNDYPEFVKAGITPQVSINISAQDLMDLTMPERFASLLNLAGISPELITIELTESAILSSVSDSLDILNRLRMKGFQLSIDDFGTGHSSLVQLYQAPFNELKIDQHFVVRMMKDDEAMSIVKICILLAKELRMNAVAEGIEDQVTLNKLRELGCNVGQGYLMSRPLPLEGICDWVKTHHK